MTLRNLKLIILSALLLISTPFSVAAQSADQKPLGNQDVIELVKAGLSSEVVITKIKSSACNFDTSPAALKDLKSATVPDAVILAILQASSANTGNTRAETASATLEQILDKYVQAKGGREAFQRRTSTHEKSTGEQSGKAWQIEIFEKAPNKRLIISTAPNEEFRDGFDGSVGWASNRMGVRERAPQELAISNWLAEFGWNPRPTANMTVKGDQVVGNRPVNVIEVDLKDSGLVRMYFDKDTGLMLRRDTEENLSQGRQAATWYYEDFREVNGRKVAFVRRQADGLRTVKVALVEDNVSIDDGMFAKPSGKTIPTNSVRAIAYPDSGVTTTVTFAAMQNGRAVPLMPDWAIKWVTDNQKKYPDVRFQTSGGTVAGGHNYVIVFSFSTGELHGFQPVTHTSSATSTSTSTATTTGTVSGDGTVTNMRTGGMWDYTYNGNVDATTNTTTTTTTTTTTHENVPYSRTANTIYLTSYGEQGQMLSQRWHVYSTQQGGDTSYQLGYNLGNAVRAIHARSHLLEDTLKDLGITKGKK